MYAPSQHPDFGAKAQSQIPYLEPTPQLEPPHGIPNLSKIHSVSTKSIPLFGAKDPSQHPCAHPKCQLNVFNTRRRRRRRRRRHHLYQLSSHVITLVHHMSNFTVFTLLFTVHYFVFTAHAFFTEGITRYSIYYVNTVHKHSTSTF